MGLLHHRLSPLGAIGMLGCGWLLSGSALAAQQPNRASGTVKGLIRDDAGKAVPAVEVTAGVDGPRIRSDSLGGFVFAALPAGPATLYFRRLAYAPDTATIDVPANDTTNIDVTLTVVAQHLSAVVVQDDPNYRRLLRDFESRRRAGFGHFITRADIERRQPRVMSEMLRLIPGAVLVPGPAGTERLRFSRSAGSRDCPPQYWMDGLPVDRYFNIDDIAPMDVEGVEIYAGPSVTPPQFAGMNTTAACGTVAIWTRVP